MENRDIIMSEYEKKERLYQSFTSEVEHLLKKILEAEGIMCNAITSRLKDRESLKGKLIRKNDKYESLSDITDIAGIRVITYYTEDVDKVAEIVEREFEIDKENSIDKRDALEPDRFGYCSIHYVVKMSPERLRLREMQAYSDLKCEIQIRSVLQHAWAEIEHDLGYKSAIAIPKNIRRNFSRLASLLEIADKEFQEIRDFLQAYQRDAVEKMEKDELQDAEIDAILLETVIDTNPDIAKLNETIRSLFDCSFSEKIPTDRIESMIAQLRWFGIDTVSQLKDFIERNKEGAASVARGFIKTSEEGGQGPISKTIAFFYLCYAEVLRRGYDYEQIMQYFVEMHIGKDEDDREMGVQRLLQIGNSQAGKGA